jgi:hypothetical protein
MIILAPMLISAWPYQLNTTSGALYDLNASNNATNNFTIYVVNQTYILQNYTIQNISVYMNLTNTTCYNCTQNYYYIINASNATTYNTTQTDTKFLTLADFDTYKSTISYPSMMEFNSLASRVQNITDNGLQESSHAGLWAMSIISVLLGLLALFLAYTLGNSGSS